MDPLRAIVYAFLITLVSIASLNILKGFPNKEIFIFSGASMFIVSFIAFRFWKKK